MAGPVNAQSESAALPIIPIFERTMQWVVDNELEAPAASRLYALTAIILYDSWHISQNQNGYLLGPDEIAESLPRTFTVDSLDLFFSCLEPDRHHEKCHALKETDKADVKLVSRAFNKLALMSPTEKERQGPKKHSIHPEWRRAPLLELKSADRFRPLGPPSELDENFDKAVLEVKYLGEDVSEYRLADDSLSAAFWGNPAGTITPPGHWNDIALEQIRPLSPDAQLDILLALNITLYDAGVAAWDSKFHFLYERPHEKIRRTDPENRSWTAMGVVPLHPEYVSGHSAFSGAAAEVLTAFLGERSFCNSSKSMWELERCFDSFNLAAEEAGQSRIYGGLHYQFSNQDGLELGRNVAQYVLDRLQDKTILSSDILLSKE